MMKTQKINVRIFSAFTLKIIACVCMFIDHIGVVLFPQCEWMRIIGRIAYPLFAFFIAEGCRYTSNKLKRFLSVFILGALCEIVFVIMYREYYGNILLTFSISILLIYLLQYSKKSYYISYTHGNIAMTLFVACIVVAYLFCEYVGVDYGFFGVMTPVAVTLFDDVSQYSKDSYNKSDKRLFSIIMFAISLILVSIENTELSVQPWCLLSLLFVLMYNGERGKYSLKYGFYLFYPLHIVLIEGISLLIN